jgi:hypothetical protein
MSNIQGLQGGKRSEDRQRDAASSELVGVDGKAGQGCEPAEHRCIQLGQKIAIKRPVVRWVEPSSTEQEKARTER